MRARTCGPSGEFHVYEHPPAEHLRSPQIHLHRQFKAAQPLVTLRRLLPSGFFRSSCCARRRNQWQRGSTGQRRPRSGSSKKEPAPSEEEQNRKDHCDDEKNVHDRYLPFSLKCSTMAPPPGLARRVHCNPGLPAPDDRAWATAMAGECHRRSWGSGRCSSAFRSPVPDHADASAIHAVEGAPSRIRAAAFAGRLPALVGAALAIGGEVLSWPGSLSRPAGLAGAAVRARLAFTGLRVLASAGIQVRIQLISFPDPFRRTLTDSPGVLLTIPGLPSVSPALHAAIASRSPGRTRFAPVSP